MADDLWLVLPHLGAGGAQKVALMAAERFACQGFSVRVVTWRNDHPIVHAIPVGVCHQQLKPEHPPGLGGKIFASVCHHAIRTGLLLIGSWLTLRLRPGRTGWAWAVFRRGTDVLGGAKLQELRHLIRSQQPRRMVSFLGRTNIRCCLAAWELPVHLVVSERNDPSRQRLDRFWSLLRTLCYQRADVVTANTQGVLDALHQMGPWKQLALLPNPLPAGVHRKDNLAFGPQIRQRHVLAVARLVPQKGLDVLIRAFASLPGSVRDGWKLVLVGDGPERQALTALAHQLDLGDSLIFAGFQADPFPFMARAAIFALPSRYEGMPNALLEAMAAGLPSVVSDASPGPLEMVCDGQHGLVVPTEDVAALRAALERLMLDSDLRERLGDEAKKSLAARDWKTLEPHWRAVLALPPL